MPPWSRPRRSCLFEASDVSLKSSWTFCSRVTYHEHAIRSSPHKTAWHAAHGHGHLTTPPPLKNVHKNDLYVHKTQDGQQAWIRLSGDIWAPVERDYPHPSLRGYVLTFLKNGDPRWITKASLQKYKDRENRARRQTIGRFVFLPM